MMRRVLMMVGLWFALSARLFAADWAVNYGNGSSTGYYAVSQWAAVTSYSIGDLRRQLAAPSVGNERVFRCTTAGVSGASEPTWTLTKGSTTNDGTAVWTEVTGNSTYNWSAPHARLANAFAWGAAGDNFYASDNHAETQASAMTLTSPGTAASPCNVLCVDDAVWPPTTLATTATVTTTGANAMSFLGFAYCEGVAFAATTTASNAMMNFTAGAAWGWTFKNGALKLLNTNSGGRINVGVSTSSNFNQRLELCNTTIEIGHASQGIIIRCPMIWRDTPSAIAGATLPTTLFVTTTTGPPAQLRCVGVDFSALASGKNLVDKSMPAPNVMLFQDCKLGSSVALTTGTHPGQGGPTIVLANSDSADTNYRYEKVVYQGSVFSESTIVRTGGATDGTTPISRKMVSSANSKFYWPLESDFIYAWNETTGSSVTVTAETVTDNVTLTDAEAWIEVEYLGTSGFPIASTSSDRAASVLTTPTNQTTSSETWTTTGLTTPVKQKLSVTFTPQEKGMLRARVLLAKASTTMYFCPKVIDNASGKELMVMSPGYLNEYDVADPGGSTGNFLPLLSQLRLREHSPFAIAP